MTRNFETTKQMLLQVLNGHTYAAVGEEHRLGKTAVEKRVKTMVEHLIATVGVDGMNPGTVLSAYRLRASKEPIVEALARFDPGTRCRPCARR